MPFKSLISALCKSVSLLLGFFSPRRTAFRCRVREWSKFCRSVTYSRFSRQLFVLLKSMWFTSRLLGPTKANNTNRWTAFSFSCPLRHNFTRKYPPVTGRSTSRTSLLRLNDLTCPQLLTKYLPSYPGIALQISILCLTPGCSTIQIPELRPGITLPASGDGYRVDTVTGKDETIPAEKWKLMLPRAIVIFSDDWAILKTVTLNNCMQSDKCAQAVGVLDSLFQIIDQALQKLPSP